MKFALMLLVCCIVSPAIGAFERVSLGSRSAAMGGGCLTTLANSCEMWSNPSLAAGPTKCVLLLNYVPQPFGLNELSRASVSFIVPTSAGTFALSGSRFGFDLYREITLTATYAQEIDSELSIGANLNWYSLMILNYGSASAIGADLGLSVKVAESARWGFSVQNVNAPTIGRENEKLPQVFSTGIACRPTDESTVSLDLVKDVRYPAEVHLGVEYSFFDLLDVRAGTSTDPSAYSAGIGFRYAAMELDYAFTTHTELGSTHQFSFAIAPGEL